MRSLLISLLVVLLAATIQAGVFKKEKVKLGKKNCLCDFNIEIGDTCSGSVKCDKKCSGSGTVELGGCSFTLAVKKGKGKISKCSCEAATLPVPTEPTIGPGSGETPVPMTGSGSGETPVPMTGSGSGETPVPIPTSPGSGSGGEGMQCSCKCNCPDGSGECDCDCNCPMTSKTVTCAPGFSKVCPMMGDMCPQDMDPICPHNAISRMGGNAAEGMDKGCQCFPDFLLAMVMIQPTGRMEAVDRAMTKATIQVGKKKCKCSYEMNAENCKKSKIVCDKKCSGKESGVELADGAVMYMVDIAVKKGKVTIAKCDVEAPEPTGAGGGSTGSGFGNGEGGMGGMGSRCACVSKGMGGSGPTVPTLPPTGSGSEPAPPTGSGSEPALPTGSGSEPAPPTGSGSEPAPPTGSGSGSGRSTCAVQGQWVGALQSASGKASTWEKCGNICYKEKDTYTIGWTWNPSTENCALFKRMPPTYARIDPNSNLLSGRVFCPVEDCSTGQFSNWWSAVSPCFKKRVLKEKIYNPWLCESEPKNTMKEKTNQAIEALTEAVFNSELKNLAEEMHNDVPDDYKEYCPGDFASLIKYLKVVATITPPFTNDAPGYNYLGVPITTVLLCYLHTQKGRIFFANNTVNTHMRNIVNAYGDLLQSKDSLTVFNELQYGWQSKCARKLLDMDQFNYIPDEPAWGFDSFNDFFTRSIHDIKKNRPCDDGPYVLTSFGDVTEFYNQTDVEFETPLWAKNESYSLKQMFNDDEQAKKFVGGAVLQAYFSAHKYHRYHSPASGIIQYAEKVPGIIYAIDEINAGVDNNLTDGKNISKQEKLNLWLENGQNGVIETELYLAHVATRCIYVIDNNDLGPIGLVFIGMTEISSCTMIKKAGDSVYKGEELGLFQFGGSSGLVALSNKTVDNAATGPTIWSQNQKKTWKVCEKIVDLSPKLN